MKKYEITELMREYTADEFGIEGENAADTEKVVESVMGQVKPKGKVKPLFKVLVAAAAMCVVGGSVVGASILTSGQFTTAAGREITFGIYHDHQESTATVDGLETLVTLEDGRLYFNVNGESTDITDLTDSQTPYIYSYTVSETGKPAYIIAGGTPEEYGVVELIYMDVIGWQGDGAINGEIYGRDLSVRIYDPDDRYSYVHGWYRSNKTFNISNLTYLENNDGEYETLGHWHGSEVDILPTWRDECEEAWLIEGLAQLGLIELPDAANFSAPELYVNDEGRLMWKRHSEDEWDLTDDISEDTPYVYDMIRSDASDCYFVFGGTPEDYGWAVISRYDDEYWTIGSENITNADGQLREWYVNAVEKVHFDLDQLQQNHFFTSE